MNEIEVGKVVAVTDVAVGQQVMAITGSTKTKDWQNRKATVIGFRFITITATHGYLSALVEFEDGTKASSHRLKAL